MIQAKCRACGQTCALPEDGPWQGRWVHETEEQVFGLGVPITSTSTHDHEADPDLIDTTAVEIVEKS